MATAPKKMGNDPLKHKSGKTRLGPLNLDQVNKMLASTSKPKEKVKINNRIAVLTKLNPPKVVVEAPVESPVEDIVPVVDTVSVLDAAA